MHLRRRGENHGLDPGLLQALGEIARPVRDVELAGDFLGRLGITADERSHFDTLDVGDALEVFLAESALACHANFHLRFSKIRCPTAVFDAGTW